MAYVVYKRLGDFTTAAERENLTDIHADGVTRTTMQGGVLTGAESRIILTAHNRETGEVLGACFVGERYGNRLLQMSDQQQGNLLDSMRSRAEAVAARLTLVFPGGFHVYPGFVLEPGLWDELNGMGAYSPEIAQMIEEAKSGVR